MKRIWNVVPRCVVVGLLASGIAGCGGAPAPSSTGGGASPEAASNDPGPAPEGQQEPPEDDAAVELVVADWAGVESMIAAHPGKVVVVDLWSTSCIPCRREFPNLVQLQKELGDKIACISVSADYDGIPSKPVETYREKVLEFLVHQQATFQNVLSSTAAEDLFDGLKIGSIPAVFVYDQTGRRVKVFSDPVEGEEFTYAGQIRPFVESLLAAQSAP